MTRHPQLESFLQSLVARSDMGEPTARMLLAGSDHRYECRCETCLEWWTAVGPEYLGDGRYGYGPFTEAEIEASKKGDNDAKRD